MALTHTRLKTKEMWFLISKDDLLVACLLTFASLEVLAAKECEVGLFS